MKTLKNRNMMQIDPPYCTVYKSCATIFLYVQSFGHAWRYAGGGGAAVFGLLSADGWGLNGTPPTESELASGHELRKYSSLLTFLHK